MRPTLSQSTRTRIPLPPSTRCIPPPAPRRPSPPPFLLLPIFPCVHHRTPLSPGAQQRAVAPIHPFRNECLQRILVAGEDKKKALEASAIASGRICSDKCQDQYTNGCLPQMCMRGDGVAICMATSTSFWASSSSHVFSISAPPTHAPCNMLFFCSFFFFFSWCSSSHAACLQFIPPGPDVLFPPAPMFYSPRPRFPSSGKREIQTGNGPAKQFCKPDCQFTSKMNSATCADALRKRPTPRKVDAVMADVGPYPSPDPLQHNAETAAFHSFMGHPTMSAIEALLEGFLHTPGLWPPVTSVSSSTPFVRHFPAQFPPF